MSFAMYYFYTEQLNSMGRLLLSSISRKGKLSGSRQVVAGAKSGFNWVAITSLLSASVPVLYVIGRAYNDYYLHEYGISADLFPRSTADYLYMAASGIFVSIIHFFSYSKNEWQSILKMIALISLYAVLIGFSGMPEVRSWYQSFVKHTEQSPIKRVLLYAGLGPLIVFLFFLFCCLVIMLLGIPLSIGQSAGMQAARYEMKTSVCAADAPANKDCIDVSKSNDLIFSGRMIAASATHVAMADGVHVKVFLKDGLSFEVRHK